jgi:hypothetical protein
VLRSLLAAFFLAISFVPALALAEPSAELAMRAAPDRATQCADKTRRAIDEHAKQHAMSAIVDHVEMPWIWVEIRRMAETRLPSHEQDEFRVVLGPAVVSSGFDTVVGVGVGGHY